MKVAMFVFLTGLLVTLGGVGGIEHSTDMMSSLIVAGMGLSIMAVGSMLIRRNN